MSFDSDIHKNWLEELERFIYLWEQEAESIKQKTLNLNECNDIAEVFQRGSNGLLVRRPLGISDEEIYSRLEKLDGKLNSVLAMACKSELKTTKRF